MLEYGTIEGFQPFASCQLLDRSPEVYAPPHPCYAVAVQHRTRLWRRWRPRSVEESPPVPGDRGAFGRCGSFGEALTRVRKFNLDAQAGCSTAGPASWAVVACVHQLPAEAGARLTTVTPLAYHSLETGIASPWRPTHLLDVPPDPWKFQVKADGDFVQFNTLESAVDEVMRHNRAKWNGGGSELSSWHLLVAVERSALFERVDCRSWQPRQGVMSLELSRRFHLFDRSTWPLPEGVDLQIPK